MFSRKDQRTLERKPYSHRIDLEVSDLEAEKPRSLKVTGKALDISSNGIGLLTEAPLNRGEVIKIYIPIAFLKAVLPSFSEVRWVQHTKRHYRVGLQFLA